MGKMIIIWLSLVLCVSFAHAQFPITVRGAAKDSSGTPLSKATIRVISEKDSSLQLSGEDGTFSIDLADRKFMILVTMKGYRSYRREFSVPEKTKIFPLPPIEMIGEYQELQAVTVLPPYTIRPDTLEYHAGAYSMRDGSMLADLVKKLPGVRLTIDSNIFVMGKKISRVMVDGKDFFGGNVQNAIRNLPYDIIESVEVIDDWGDQARLIGLKKGDPEKVLNIVLKSDRRNGQFGSLEGGPGSHDQYSAIAVANAFAGDRKLALVGGLTNNNPFGRDYGKYLSLSYADRWSPAWSGSGDASLSSDDKTLQNSSIQDSYYSGGHIDQEQDNVTHTNGQAQSVNYEWVYTHGLNTKLRINSSFSRQGSTETDQISQSSLESDSGFTKSTRSTTLNQYRNQGTTAESKIAFEQFYPHSGQRFSVDAGLKYSSSRQTGDNQNQIQTSANSVNSQILQHYKVDNGNTIWDLGTNLHYYFPLGAGGFLETGYSLHQSVNQSTRHWQQPDSSGNWQLVDSLSNDFDFRTRVQDFRAGYTLHNDKTDLDLALIAEPGSLEGTTSGKRAAQPYRYFNFLPTGSFSYSLSREQRLRLGYNSSVTPPSLQQIQPVTDLSNLQYPVTGNPNLRPATTQLVNLGYNRFSLKPNNYWGFGIGIGYTEITDMIVSNIVHPKDSSSVIQQTFFENTNGNYLLSLSTHVDLPELFRKHLKITLSGMIGEAHSVSITDYIPLIANILTINQNLNLQWAIPDKVDATTYFIYTHSLTQYDGSAGLPTTASSIIWGMNNHHYLKDWILTYEFMQTFNSGVGSVLSSDPIMLNIRLERAFLHKRQLSCMLSVANITNANVGNTQTVTENPLTITQNRANLVGRRIFFTLRWKFERFPKRIGKPKDK